MLDPRGLIDIMPALGMRQELRSPVLVNAMEGFVDAGAGVRLLREHLLSTSEPRLVATFDADQLIDYRARRPVMRFDRDHWASMALPAITVHALQDRDGQAYLLLSGPEPDTQWQRFVAAVGLLVHELGVRLVVGLDAVPLAVPHTRPLGVTAHASRAELLVDHQSWFDEALVPGSVGHALEFLLGHSGYDTAGFAVHVPQYLAQSEYPAASLRLAQALGGLPRLNLVLNGLEAAAAEVTTKVSTEADDGGEIASMITGLEQQYDAFVSARAESGLAPGGRLPSADELGSEFERFLAEQTHETGEG